MIIALVAISGILICSGLVMLFNIKSLKRLNHALSQTAIDTDQHVIKLNNTLNKTVFTLDHLVFKLNAFLNQKCASADAFFDNIHRQLNKSILKVESKIIKHHKLFGTAALSLGIALIVVIFQIY